MLSNTFRVKQGQIEVPFRLPTCCRVGIFCWGRRQELPGWGSWADPPEIVPFRGQMALFPGLSAGPHDGASLWSFAAITDGAIVIVNGFHTTITFSSNLGSL